MADYYISPTGNDSTGNGSSALPWLTLQKACLSVLNGDTIYLADGNYSSEAIVDLSVNTVTILSSSGKANQCILTLPDTRDHYFAITGSNTIIKNVLFKIDSNSVLREVIRLEVSKNLTLIGCGFIFSGVSDEELLSYVRLDQWLGTVPTINIYKCTFIGGGHHIYLINTGAGTNTVNLTIKDSILSSALVKSVYAEDGGISVNLSEDYNCWYNNVANDITPTGEHNITSNPDITSEITADSDSPCRDAGVVVAGAVTTYFGSAPDMGAYEYSFRATQVGNLVVNGVISDKSNDVTVSDMADAVVKKHSQNTDTQLDSGVVTVTAADNVEITGELKIKVYRQGTEPILAVNDYMAIWINTGDLDKVYLVFRRGVGDQVGVELDGG